MLYARAHTYIYEQPQMAIEWEAEISKQYLLFVFLNATPEQLAKPYCNFSCKNTCVGMQIVCGATKAQNEGN